MRMRLRSFALSLIMVFSAINLAILPNSQSDPTPLDLEQVTFTNVTYEAGLSGVGGQFLAWGDYNNDDYQDLLINGRWLLKNNGPPNWDFTDVSNEVGISGGSYGTWADWNNDGFLDFFCAGSDTLW
ncbi:MAG: VCBS repeat-containing protein, partial [Thermoplasmata archaeon]